MSAAASSEIPRSAVFTRIAFLNTILSFVTNDAATALQLRRVNTHWCECVQFFSAELWMQVARSITLDPKLIADDDADSTGSPPGVPEARKPRRLTHEQLLARMANMCLWRSVIRTGRMLWLLPLFVQGGVKVNGTACLPATATQPEVHRSPLATAALYGATDAVRALLEAGAEVDRATCEVGMSDVVQYGEQNWISVLPGRPSLSWKMRHGAWVNGGGVGPSGAATSRPILPKKDAATGSDAAADGAGDKPSSTVTDTGEYAAALADGSPLHLAATQGYPEVCRVLIRNHADWTLTDRWGMTALHHAARRGDAACCAAILDEAAAYVARQKDEATGKEQQGAEEAAAVAGGETTTTTTTPSRLRPASLKETLLQRSQPWMPPSLRGTGGLHALHFACASGSIPALTLLLDRLDPLLTSADFPEGGGERGGAIAVALYDCDCQGLSPLCHAVASDRLAVVEHLIGNAGNADKFWRYASPATDAPAAPAAAPTAAASARNTATAPKKGKIFQPRAPPLSASAAATAAAAAEPPPAPTLVPPLVVDEPTPLHVAAMNGTTAIAELLIKRRFVGANVISRSWRHSTPLMLAVDKLGAASLAVVRALLPHLSEADVLSVTDDDGYNALARAVRALNDGAVNLLFLRYFKVSLFSPKTAASHEPWWAWSNSRFSSLVELANSRTSPTTPPTTVSRHSLILKQLNNAWPNDDGRALSFLASQPRNRTPLPGVPSPRDRFAALRLRVEEIECRTRIELEREACVLFDENGDAEEGASADSLRRAAILADKKDDQRAAFLCDFTTAVRECIATELDFCAKMNRFRKSAGFQMLVKADADAAAAATATGSADAAAAKQPSRVQAAVQAMFAAYLERQKVAAVALRQLLPVQEAARERSERQASRALLVVDDEAVAIAYRARARLLAGNSNDWSPGEEERNAPSPAAAAPAASPRATSPQHFNPRDTDISARTECAMQ